MMHLFLAAALGVLALSCTPQGVSLGSEEACVLDPKIALAQESYEGEPLPACAAIGPNQLVNQGMENPPVATVSDCQPDFCQVPAAQVWGWRTTSETQVMELWTDGYLGAPAAQGRQFIELDADTPDTIYQDVVLAPGEAVYWSVLHRGRLGEETIEILLGPPESPGSQGSYTSSDRGWQQHSGIYRVAADESVTRFAIASRSGTMEGNLVDDAVLSPIESE